MRKKALTLLTLAALLLTACGTKKDSDILKKLAKELEAMAESMSEEAEQNARETEKEDKGDSDASESVIERPDLEIDIQMDYLSEYNGQATLCRGQSPSIQINSQDYPELARGLEDFNRESSRQVTESYNQLLGYAREAYDPSYSFISYEFMRNIVFRRADSSVLSFWVDDTEYSGGAHGFDSRIGKNYDVNTGMVIGLEDVATDVSRFSALIQKQLLEKYPRDSFSSDFEETIENQFHPESPSYQPPQWTLDYTGITFYYDAYELGSHAIGTQQVTLAFAKYPELFKEPYSKAVEQFAVPLEIYTEMLFDLDRDGSTETLCLMPSATLQSYSMDCQLTIQFNGQEITHSCYGGFSSAFLAKMANGQCYLYAETIGDSDSPTIYIFSLTHNSISFIGEYYESFYGYTITNPSRFKLSCYLAALSSYTGYRYYTIGGNGMPEPLEDTYTIISYPESPERYLTAKIPIPVRMVSADGTVDSEATYLPSGTIFYFYKTDGASFVEMELQDGRHCQIHFDTSDWPRTIEGRDENEWLDGIMYAG